MKIPKNHFTFSQFIVPNFKKKFLLMFFSILLMGFFLSFLIEVGWGTDPASFLNLNVSHVIGWTFGNWQLTLNLLMLIVLIVFRPTLIGFGTICNMVLIGYTADFFCFVWRKTALHDFILQNGFSAKIAFFSISIVAFVFVAAVYMNSEMGLSPYDGVAKFFSQALPFPFFVSRMIYDLSFVAIGFGVSFLSADGIQGSALGASIISLLLGPAITLVGKLVKKFL